MRSLPRRLLAVPLALGLALALASPALAAGWWTPGPLGPGDISQLASNQSLTTLAIAHGRAGWYQPLSGGFAPVLGLGPARLVAASGDRGVVALTDGGLRYLGPARPPEKLTGARGQVQELALGEGSRGSILVATSKGLYSGVPGARLRRVAKGDATQVVAPPLAQLSWFALAGGRLLSRRGGGGPWRIVPHSPDFGTGAGRLQELGDGAVVVTEPQGLVWSGNAGSLAPVFQILPYGGLGGVPRVTAVAADGATAVYLGTSGFGTLLTPDQGYSWYRAGPSDPSVTGLASLGPVFSTHAHGYVVALTPDGTFLHRLQELPAPPVYPPARANSELLDTALVTAIAAGLVLLALLLMRRRQSFLRGS